MCVCVCETKDIQFIGCVQTFGLYCIYILKWRYKRCAFVTVVFSWPSVSPLPPLLHPDLRDDLQHGALLRNTQQPGVLKQHATRSRGRTSSPSSPPPFTPPTPHPPAPTPLFKGTISVLLLKWRRLLQKTVWTVVLHLTIGTTWSLLPDLFDWVFYPVTDADI